MFRPSECYGDAEGDDREDDPDRGDTEDVVRDEGGEHDDERRPVKASGRLFFSVASVGDVGCGGCRARGGWRCAIRRLHWPRVLRLLDQYAARHVPGDGHDDRADAAAHAGQHVVDHEIRAEGGVEEGDDAQHQEGRDDGTEHREQDAREAADLVAHDDRAIDRDRARCGLCDRDEIQHFVLADPVQVVDELLFQQRHDDIAAPEGEGAEIQGLEEELPETRAGAWSYIGRFIY